MLSAVSERFLSLLGVAVFCCFPNPAAPFASSVSDAAGVAMLKRLRKKNSNRSDWSLDSSIFFGDSHGLKTAFVPPYWGILIQFSSNSHRDFLDSHDGMDGHRLRPYTIWL